MDHIMTDLALKAYNNFDAALRSLFQTRMLACCLGGMKGKSADKSKSLQSDEAYIKQLFGVFHKSTFKQACMKCVCKKDCKE